MKQRKLGAACAVAACALIAAAPTSAVAKKAEPKTNTAQADKALAELKGQVASLGQQVAEVKSTAGAVEFIMAAAPQIVDGLTQLKTGLETLAGAYQAVEYGVAQVNVVGGGSIVNPPAWSGDIPDDGNGTTTSGTALWPNFGGAVTKTFSVNAYVRSNEADCCSGQSGPVAQGGALMSVTASNPATGSTSFLFCAGDVTTGGVGGITRAGEPINTPDGAKKDQPLTNIVTGKPRTDQTRPGSDAPTLATCTVSVPASPAPGLPMVVQVQWNASFLDIPTTTSPGPRD
jgi:hypothetical protein